ncbi:class I SAM-dependent methyltransferase [Streptomyces coeruleorubidus]|uniref:class I SAM-dependent methyltransferase n=1 Tax=Streptomyces coeruleorubidus TaxID=116188 RepID=UPI00237FD066|nr:class I SAM-dependent methyltransferase [Streptomyces coeruleorubidus]WDV50930.1 class I SAM-dependent methyltransferase [Streptomyces coeruleorubidus]
MDTGRGLSVIDVPERLTWAVQVLDPAPGDRVLEIGCGRGVAVALIRDRLVTGTVTGIDRSAKAVEAARRRNSDALATGRAAFHTLALEDADFAISSFDKILAVNVNLFWTRPADRELAALRRWLAPGGLLCLCWEPPDGKRTGEIAAKVEPAVAGHGFATEVRRAATARGAGLVGVLGVAVVPGRLSGEGRPGQS